MGGLLQITLGILTALGGFIDIGELVFSVQAGVKFGFMLLWAVLLGTVGIILFTEMSGRVAAVLKKPVFTLVKEQFPKPLSLSVLIASMILNALTCAAELGGVAIALQLLTGLNDLPAILLTTVALAIIIWLLPFKFLEKSFGLLGLLMIVFLVSVFVIHPSFKAISAGFIPKLPDTQNLATYLYFAIGIISSSMMPYEVYFYSSGGIEEGWKPKDLLDNKITAVVGMFLGATLAISLIILGATIFGPAGITPQLHGTSALLATLPLGKVGLYLALIGIIFTLAGAATETCLAGGYNLAQYFNWPWGRYTKPEKTPKFTLVWILILIFAFFILMLGVDPVQLVEYAVIFSVLALPFSYYPILKVSADKKLMHQHANGKIINVSGWIFFIIISIIAVAAIPLMIISNMGNG